MPKLKLNLKGINHLNKKGKIRLLEKKQNRRKRFSMRSFLA